MEELKAGAMNTLSHKYVNYTRIIQSDKGIKNFKRKCCLIFCISKKENSYIFVK